MFVSCRYITKDAGYWYYEIVDSLLGSRTIELPEVKIFDVHDLENSAYMTAAVIKFYTANPKENVARNIALFYEWWNNKQRFNTRAKRIRELDFESIWLDVYYPRLNYRKLYFVCVQRQIKKLQFISGNKT